MIFKARKELYQFKLGDKSWYFANGTTKAVTHNNITYLPIKGLKRTNIEDAGIDKADIDLTFPQDSLKNTNGDDLAQVFIGKIYYESVTVTILELHKNETLVLFKGRVTQPKFDESAKTMTLVASTNETYQHRNILVRKVQRTCPNKIYDRFCGLNFSEWSQDAIVTAINGLSVTLQIVTPIANNYLNRGLIEKDGIYIFIVSNTGNQIRMYRPFHNLKIGDVVRVAPGCDQSIATCNEKFNNHINFAGFPNMPNENPVMQQIVR